MARVAFILGPMFEDSEFQHPYDGLKKAGHECRVVGTEAGQTLEGKQGEVTAKTDSKVTDEDPNDFDALVIPGGYSPDKLRTDENIVGFIRRFTQTGRPVAAICHGPQLLIEANVVKGTTMTSWPSVRTDLKNAGANWVDRELVEDGQFISSRKPDDLDAFTNAILKRLES